MSALKDFEMSWLDGQEEKCLDDFFPSEKQPINTEVDQNLYRTFQQVVLKPRRMPLPKFMESTFKYAIYKELRRQKLEETEGESPA